MEQEVTPAPFLEIFMAKPFDLSKLRTSLTKAIGGTIGFHDPKTWIHTGNYCLNFLISGDFFRGVPLGKVTLLAGATGGGKSLIASGNVVKHAQEMGILVVMVDSENALDESWLQALGVDTSPDKLIRVCASMVNEVAEIIQHVMDGYKATPEADRPKLLFVIDSLSMLTTPIAAEQFAKGDLKGDMGHLPKQLKALVKNCVNQFGQYEVGMICTNHTYASQDMYNPDDKVSGGSGPLYAASIAIGMKPAKLKTDAEGNKVTDVRGIRSKCTVIKSRYNQPFTSTEINIPWDAGMDPYSGLFDFFLANGTLVKDGNKYVYTDTQGQVHSHWRKEYLTNVDNILDQMMKEFDPKKLKATIDRSADESDEPEVVEYE